jgi:hypothetical protein
MKLLEHVEGMGYGLNDIIGFLAPNHVFSPIDVSPPKRPSGQSNKRESKKRFNLTQGSCACQTETERRRISGIMGWFFDEQKEPFTVFVQPAGENRIAARGPLRKRLTADSRWGNIQPWLDGWKSRSQVGSGGAGKPDCDFAVADVPRHNQRFRPRAIGDPPMALFFDDDSAEL